MKVSIQPNCSTTDKHDSMECLLSISQTSTILLTMVFSMVNFGLLVLVSTIVAVRLEIEIELDSIFLSAITKMELLLGARSKEDLAIITNKLNRFNIVLINEQITLKSFELLCTYKLSHGLSIPDCLIAATAIVSNFELYTYNTKDYQFIDQLRLYKY